MLVLVDASPGTVIVALGTAIIGMFGIAGGVSGYFLRPSKPLERLILFGSGLMLVNPNYISSGIGLVLLGTIFIMQRLGKHKTV